jgi:ribosomal 30S subunit maturation factor RimM
MHYETGQEIKVGDIVDMHGMAGRVVFNIEGGSYADDYPEGAWSFLQRGVGVVTEEAGLIHTETVEDLVLIKRAAAD